MDGLNLNPNEGMSELVDTQTEQVETTVETVNADNVSVTTDGQEETKPIQQLAEENSKFASIRREYEQKIAQAEQKAIDAEYSRLYGDSHGIHSKADYDEAIARQEQEEQLSELLVRNISEEDAAEIIEARKLREQVNSEKTARQQQEQQQADMKDFISNFPDVKADDIPKEVWQANANGIPLRYAYAEHALKLTKIAEIKAKANEENARGSMGSVSGDGVSDVGYFTADQVKGMTQAEVTKHLSTIENSMKKWK